MASRINIILISIGIMITSIAGAVNKDLACPNGFCPGLGELFYLPSIDTVGVNTNGTTIWKKAPLLDDCATLTTPIRQGNDSFRGSDSASSFFSSLASDSKVSGDVKTLAFSMKASAEAQTGKTLNITSTFHSEVYDRSEIQGVVDFNKDASCQTIDNLSDYFLSRFKALPWEITKPGSYSTNNDSWGQYNAFLKEQGSHYLIQMTYGSRFQIWSSTTTTEKDVSTMLKARACLELEGSSGTSSASATGCSGIDSQTRETSKNLDIQTKKVVRGGLKSKREALINKTSPELMADFIKDAPDSDQPVTWNYRPIWEFLQSEYRLLCSKGGPDSEDCKNYQRAINLQAAFEGSEGWGCQYATSDGVVLGGMKLGQKNTQGVAYWSCVQAKTGCVDDDGCAYQTGYATAHCVGQRCLDEQLIDGTNQYRTVFKGDVGSLGKDDGVNKSCYLHAKSFWTYGYCDTKWAGGKPEREIWAQNRTVNLQSNALSALDSAAQSLNPSETGSSDEETYKVTVRIASNVKEVSKIHEKTSQNVSLSGKESGTTKSTVPRSFVVLSYPLGINCPGASCSNYFRRGEKVTVAWLDNSKNIRFVKWDSDRCVGEANKIPVSKLTQSLGIGSYDGPSIPFDGANEASLCTFIVDEDITLDAEVLTTKSN